MNTQIETAINTLIDAIRSKPEERALIPAQDFWARFDMVNPSNRERDALADELRQRQLSVTFDTRRNAVYLVWMGKALKAKKKPMSKKQRETRAALLATPPMAIDLTKPRLRALSIRQPYVELILLGKKQQENRSWPPPEPYGPMLIHASRTFEEAERAEARKNGLKPDELVRGALVGIVDVVGVEGTDRKFHWLVTNPRRFKHSVPYSGAVGIFYVDTGLVRAEIEGMQE